ncbi:hypothetical protein GPECTOR_12g402 [Gonium pectorale]|uniref:NDUFV2 protein n=1 Tax=Gonium pectorale TaxID=33097 RepID=A0A150GNP0_GONPE|nr:hypothetical protein GPECTOR_12g402 [Gonium pectorale]|eukprot:KXZ51439.1 hypothetical protein GPECTOR_12g402 [Gonium pectorale]
MLSKALLLAGRLASASGSQHSASAVARTVQPLGSLLQRFGFATNSTDVFNIHKDTPQNNPNTTFDFTEANLKVVNDIIARYPPNYKASAIIPVLDVAQQQNGGWLSLTAMNRVAKLLEMPPIRVYEVATFYTMFNRTPIGKYHVLICGTTPCRLQGAQGIEEAVTKHLGVHIGQTTPDGLFTLGEMECMGACVNAPMVAIADYTKGVEGFEYTYYEDLTPSDMIGILDTLKKGGKPKPGSQHRSKAEPAGAVVKDKWVPKEGTTTLTGPPRAPYCRDLNA